jgi:hypothetical protein
MRGMGFAVLARRLELEIASVISNLMRRELDIC